ncbi:hypothetical protein Syun_031033 [Stephania yunnanensis]|uniref:Uncharacterized protein n=1 Tax=Stephania yunnanensis TaxID=152371 RepID=A0AAP0DZ52_9MAGN
MNKKCATCSIYLCLLESRVFCQRISRKDDGDFHLICHVQHQIDLYIQIEKDIGQDHEPSHASCRLIVRHWMFSFQLQFQRKILYAIS